MAGRNLRAEYELRLLTTASNLKRHFNEALGIVQSAQKGEIPEEDAFLKLDKLDEDWAKAIVDDIAPEEHIIRSLGDSV